MLIPQQNCIPYYSYRIPEEYQTKLKENAREAIVLNIQHKYYLHHRPQLSGEDESEPDCSTWHKKTELKQGNSNYSLDIQNYRIDDSVNMYSWEFFWHVANYSLFVLSVGMIPYTVKYSCAYDVSLYNKKEKIKTYHTKYHVKNIVWSLFMFPYWFRGESDDETVLQDFALVNYYHIENTIKQNEKKIIYF
jgi:hypothetical protein